MGDGVSTSALSWYTRVPVAEQSKHLGAAVRHLRLARGRWASSSWVKAPVGREEVELHSVPCALCLWAATTHPGDFPAGAAKRLLGAKSEIWESSTGVLQIITFPQSTLGRAKQQDIRLSAHSLLSGRDGHFQWFV